MIFSNPSIIQKDNYKKYYENTYKNTSYSNTNLSNKSFRVKYDMISVANSGSTCNFCNR